MPLPDNLFGSSVNDFNGWGPLEGFSMSERLHCQKSA